MHRVAPSICNTLIQKCCIICSFNLGVFNSVQRERERDVERDRENSTVSPTLLLSVFMPQIKHEIEAESAFHSLTILRFHVSLIPRYQVV